MQHRSESPSQNTKESGLSAEHTGLLVAAALLMLIGWGGLWQLVTHTLPRIGGELWLFFLLLQIAVTGTVIPLVRYLNVRFTPVRLDLPSSGVIVRQSTWVGLFVVTCAWLQIPRALSLPLVAFLIMVFVVVEIFLRSREIAEERR